jgi:hypothetical protein
MTAGKPNICDGMESPDLTQQEPTRTYREATSNYRHLPRRPEPPEVRMKNQRMFYAATVNSELRLAAD